MHLGAEGKLWYSDDAQRAGHYVETLNPDRVALDPDANHPNHPASYTATCSRNLNRTQNKIDKHFLYRYNNYFIDFLETVRVRQK